MMIQAKLDSLKEIKPHEIAMRFLFGGVCTVLAALIAKHFGPATGGLFLAFPAIFPAAASLIDKHEREQKQEEGKEGTVRGRLAAAVDAAGTAIGCIGLAGFALVVWRELPIQKAGTVLAEALLAWTTLSVAFWLFYKRRIDADDGTGSVQLGAQRLD
jgi:uncharacterized membrane protein